MSEFKIEKGIEPPPQNCKGRPPKWKNLANKMSEGDSVLLPRTQAESLRGVLWKQGYHCVTRKCENGVRVWKLGKRDK